METLPKHIVLDEPKVLAFWCRHFGCSEKDLTEAVNKIGSCTEEVALYLRESPGKNGLSFWWEFMR